ncbi:MAG TPA: CoA ester lyase [Kiloniellaceae bacterium]
MPPAVIRSLLFVPGHDERKIEKALAGEADAVILDLEDAVAEESKARAREVTAAWLEPARASGRAVFVRINGFDTPHALADLVTAVAGAPFGVMLPKCCGLRDVERLSHHLDALEVREGLTQGSTRILPVATETAAATLDLPSFAAAPAPRLWGLLWGGEDLSADLGAARNRDAGGAYTLPYQFARAQCLMAAAAAGAVAVDAVSVDFRDLEALDRETREALADGFTAKAAIHPAQIPVINAALTPDAEQIAWAEAVLAALDGKGAGRLEGRMVDQPHRRSAIRILARAGRAIS